MQNVKILCHKNISNHATTSQNCTPQATAVELAQLGGGGDSPQCGEMSRRDKRAGLPLNRGTSGNVINLKRLLNGKQNVWKYQNGEEKSDSDGREKDV